MEPNQLGPYRIVRKLGRGGMGTVYEGVNLDTGKPAAVKLLSVVLADDEGIRKRFHTEIETLRKLNHPNIVKLFGFGEQDDLLFYAMELVDGSSLEEELGRGRRFDWREVTRITIETCQALRHAHDRGVIHRDIKPGNLLLAADGQVKLSDFGIARLFGNSAITVAGNVLGTAEYMAPEQAAGRPVGPRADLYSLGGVMYALLARRPLFQARSFSELLQKQQFDKPDPLRKHAGNVPAVLEQIIDELLEKDPDRRIANPTVLALRLEAMQNELSLAAQTVVTESFEVPDNSDTSGTANEDRSGVDQLAATRDMHDDELDSSLTDQVAAAGRPSAQGDSPGGKAASDGEDSGEAEASGRQKPGNHFTAVAAVEPGQRESRTPWLLPQTWALAAALIAMVLAGWYFLRPPSADRLYERITTRTAADTIDSLLQAEDDMARFLNLYGNDPRCSGLREFQDRIELHRLERTFLLRARGLASTEGLLPVEQDYLEAINYLQSDPGRATGKLRALVTLYGVGHDPASRSGKCLELARRRLTQLGEQLGKHTARDLAIVQEQLDRAGQLAHSEPKRARAMYQAVIELYQDKPWAAEAVRRARLSLAEEEAAEKTSPE